MGCTHFPCQVRPGTHVVLVIVFLELEGKCLFWFPVRTDKSSWESRERKIRGDFMFLMIFWWLKTNCWEDWYETMFIDWKKLSSRICHKCRDISLPFCKEHWNSSPSHSHVVCNMKLNTKTWWWWLLLLIPLQTQKYFLLFSFLSQIQNLFFSSQKIDLKIEERHDNIFFSEKARKPQRNRKPLKSLFMHQSLEFRCRTRNRCQGCQTSWC